MIKYVTNYGSLSFTPVINEVEVEKETDKSVWIRFRGKLSRNAKRSDYGCYFSTWDEAYRFLLERAESDVEKYQAMLERAKSKLAEVQEIKLEKA